MSKHLVRKNTLIERLRRNVRLRRAKKAMNAAAHLHTYCSANDCSSCTFRRLAAENGRPVEICELCSRYPSQWSI